MKKFVVIIPSFKNEKWCEQNLNSILSQNHDNFRVIYTDDASPDETANIAAKIVENHARGNLVELISNTERLGAMHNLYNMIHSCDDDDIVITLDGDDWLANDQVLSKINEVYNSGEVWMTYGSYQDCPSNTRGCCRPYERSVVDCHMFRRAQWRASHPRTFYAWLFKRIKKEDFFDPQGKWLDMAWDLSFMIPMLEMSGHRHRYINDILYSYNNENPISDHKVNQRRQAAMDAWIRSKPKYPRL